MEKASKIYSIEITDMAWEQMIEHARFLANVSTGAANQLIDDFLICVDSLKQMPERCPWLVYDTIPFQKYRKIILGTHHMVLFQIRDKVVYITTVLNCRQDYSWLL